MESKEVDTGHRRELLELVLPFIKSENAGMDDMLDDVAYAACYDDGDLRGLAQAFEAMENEYKVGRARDIYRRLGDRDKYLELRKARVDIARVYLEYGDAQTALSWLQQVPKDDHHHNQYDQDRLLLEIYGKTGDKDRQKEVAWRIFKRHRSVRALFELLSVIGQDQEVMMST